MAVKMVEAHQVHVAVTIAGLLVHKVAAATVQGQGLECKAAQTVVQARVAATARVRAAATVEVW